MRGANEYAQLFKTGQYGRLYIVSGEHARGKTFHIFVLPAGESGVSNGPNNAPLNQNAVEVYGVTGGQRGWNETYGWLHEGKWVEDFLALVENAKSDLRSEHEKREQQSEQAKAARADKEKQLLETY
jgi:hypothetical protein